MVQPEKEEVSIFEQPEVLTELETDAKVIREKIGEIHNNVIKNYYGEKRGKIGEKIPLEDFRNIVVESFNKEFLAQGLTIQITGADIDAILSELGKFIKDTGIDFYNPETINPSEALDKMASKGYLTKEEALQCKHITKCLEEGVNPYEDDRGLFSATLPSENVRLYTDIAVASIPLWTTELHELYPELEWSWPDIDWQRILEKISLYTCDVIGGIAGGLIGLPAAVAALIGAAIGAALASLAFEVAMIIIP